MESEAKNAEPGMCYAAGKWRTPAYPIAAIVEAAMARRGLKRGGLMAEMNCRNTAKGLRHLDMLADGKEVRPDFLRRFAAAVGIDRDELDAAIEATRAVQREEARLRREAEIAAARMAFRPHLRAITERTTPQPIFIAAWVGLAFWLRVSVPQEVLALPVNDQLAAVGEIARAHYATRKGRAGPLGAIKAYLFRTEFEKAIWLDTEGMVQGDYIGAVPEGRAYLTL